MSAADFKQRTIAEGVEAGRLDKMLAGLFPELSRSRLQTLIRDEQVTVDGVVVTDAKRKVGPGVVLGVTVPPALPAEPVSEDIPLCVVYEDDDLIVIDKPAGLVVHPGAGHDAGTLVNALINHCGESLSGIGGVKRPGIVHRLDKDTSGLMVVARTLAAHTGLVDMLSRHEVERQYEAIVVGTMVAGGTVDAAIGRHMGDRLRQAVRDEEDGKHAVTHYRLRERFRAHSLIQCSLETGRTHQIRVHMAHIGHPLIGDPLYGGGLKLPKGATSELVAALRGFRRQALHAERLAFEHPVTHEPLSFSAERPADQQALIDALRHDLAEHGHDDY